MIFPACWPNRTGWCCKAFTISNGGLLPNLRIVCISDTHGMHSELRVPDGDILIHAGDFMASGNTTKEIASFNDWLASSPTRTRS
jgi:hypothetical protein